MVFKDSDIERLAVMMMAEFRENAERELRKRGALARSRGLSITASTWEQALRRVERLREDDDGSGDLQEAC